MRGRGGLAGGKREERREKGGRGEGEGRKGKGRETHEVDNRRRTDGFEVLHERSSVASVGGKGVDALGRMVVEFLRGREETLVRLIKTKKREKEEERKKSAP